MTLSRSAHCDLTKKLITQILFQERFGGLYPQLLRLCSTHFPHLCMVHDTLMSDSLDASEDSIAEINRKNDILFPKLFLPTAKKIVQVINSRLKAEN